MTYLRWGSHGLWRIHWSAKKGKNILDVCLGQTTPLEMLLVPVLGTFSLYAFPSFFSFHHRMNWDAWQGRKKKEYLWIWRAIKERKDTFVHLFLTVGFQPTCSRLKLSGGILYLPRKQQRVKWLKTSWWHQECVQQRQRIRWNSSHRVGELSKTGNTGGF